MFQFSKYFGDFFLKSNIFLINSETSVKISRKKSCENKVDVEKVLKNRGDRKEDFRFVNTTIDFLLSHF